MANFLTEKALFMCNQGGVIRCTDSGNKAVTHDGAKLLTTGATLKDCNGICQILVAAQVKPPNCKCQLSTWSGFTSKNFSGGKALLTDSSKNICSLGGTVSVKFSGHIDKITTGSNPGDMKLAAAQIVSAVAGNEKISSGEQKIFSSDNQGQSPTKTFAEAEKISTVAQNLTISKKVEHGKLFCPFDKNLQRCRTCAYPQSSTTIKNDAAKLFANYERYTSNVANRDEVDDHYYKIFASYEKSLWSYQSHHIICGNQVFAQHLELVRLANFFGYDINNALNCIRLVSREDDYGTKPGGKSASAYDIMSLSKIQWHVGGHSYKFSPKEIERIKTRIHFFKKDIQGDTILNYAELLNAELKKIETALMSHRTCRNSERQRQSFIMRMNNLSRKVKLILGSFADKPQKSFPYYVSKEAFTFAFGLPRTAKIVVVSCAEDGKFSFEKFRVERFDETIKSERGQKLLFKPIDDPKKFSLCTRNGKADCIVFCENIEYVIFADDVCKEDMPFRIDEKFSKRLSRIVDSSVKFLEENETEILIWLRDLQDDYQYTAPNKKIKERLALID